MELTTQGGASLPLGYDRMPLRGVVRAPFQGLLGLVELTTQGGTRWGGFPLGYDRMPL